jgi:hypothetical protein
MKRLTLEVSDDLFDKSKDIPWGIRSEVIRALLTRAIDAGNRHGALIYGAIMDGQFDIIPRVK